MSDPCVIKKYQDVFEKAQKNPNYKEYLDKFKIINEMKSNFWNTWIKYYS